MIPHLLDTPMTRRTPPRSIGTMPATFGLVRAENRPKAIRTTGSARLDEFECPEMRLVRTLRDGDFPTYSVGDTPGGE